MLNKNPQGFLVFSGPQCSDSRHGFQVFLSKIIFICLLPQEWQFCFICCYFKNQQFELTSFLFNLLLAVKILMIKTPHWISVLSVAVWQLNRQCRDELYWPEAVEVLGAERVGASVAKTSSYVLERTSHVTGTCIIVPCWVCKAQTPFEILYTFIIKTAAMLFADRKSKTNFSKNWIETKITTESKAVILNL